MYDNDNKFLQARGLMIICSDGVWYSSGIKQSSALLQVN